MKITKTHVYFWKSFLGNWSVVPGGIKYDGKTFPTSEHVFMYIKADIFGDEEVKSLIEKAKTPREAKDLGRRVRGFDEKTWEVYKEDAMTKALMARVKFDARFRDFLIEHCTLQFVEASPYDKIWGVGLLEDDPNIEDQSNWLGKNLLGKTMSKVAKWARGFKEFNKWRNDLIWCPSQCYYYFCGKDGNLYSIYLRWRGGDPWTADLIPLDEYKLDIDLNADWIHLDPPFFTSDELDKLTEWTMNKIKELGLI